MKIIPTRRLIGRAVRALYQPHKVFKEIQADEVMNYKTAVPFMAFGGLFFIFFHTRLVIGYWLWDFYYEPFIVIQYIFASFFNFLLGTVVLFAIFKYWFKIEPNRKHIDIAVFYLWFSWIIMPIFDFPHLFGMKTYFLIHKLPWANTFLMHFSSLITTPIRLLQVYFIFTHLFKIKLHGIKIWILAFIIVVGARFILEPSVCIPLLIAKNYGHSVNFWLMQFFTTILGLVQFYYLRRIIDGMPWKRAALKWIVYSNLFILFGIGLNQIAFAKNINGLPPSPKDLGYVNIEFESDIELGYNSNAIFSWASQREKSLVEIGPYMDGIEHEAMLLFKLKDIKFKEDSKEIFCGVGLENEDGIIKDGNPSLEIGIAKSSNDKYEVLLESTKFNDIANDDISYIFVLDKRERVKLSNSDNLFLFLKLGIHSGGDYTQPDLIKIKSINVAIR